MAWGDRPTPTQPAPCRKEQTQDITANVRAGRQEEEEWQGLLSSHHQHQHHQQQVEATRPPSKQSETNPTRLPTIRANKEQSKLTWALAEPTAAIRRTALAIFMMMKDSRGDTV